MNEANCWQAAESSPDHNSVHDVGQSYPTSEAVSPTESDRGRFQGNLVGPTPHQGFPDADGIHLHQGCRTKVQVETGSLHYGKSLDYSSQIEEQMPLHLPARTQSSIRIQKEVSIPSR